MSELPEGWQITVFDDICSFNPRHDPNLDRSQQISFIPMPVVSDVHGTIGEHDARPLEEIWKGYTHFQDGDVIFAKITPCMENGKIAIAKDLKNGLACGSTEFHVLRPRGKISPKYIWAFLRQESFRREAKQYMTGAVGQRRVPKAFLQEHSVPLPPLNEQKQIVEKLDQILEEVNSAKARLDQIPTILKNFRQSTLSNSLNEISGKLTIMENCSEFLSGYAFKSIDFKEQGTNQVLKIANVRKGIIDLSRSPAFVSGDIATQHERFQLKEDDVLISMTGTKFKRDYGFVGLITKEMSNTFVNQRVGRIRANTDIVLPKFLYFWLQAQKFQDHFFSGETGQVGQGNVGAKIIKSGPIILPDLDKQQKTVVHIENLMDLADQIEEKYNLAREQVDKITQSLLAKAFRGELVPQDPSDEPASLLLERIKAEKKKGTSKPKKTRIESDTVRAAVEA